ncbi:MAG: thioesterase family protein [Ignavibacteriae bacterium]|nr:thioesterase family protein [Ignavibacteriota bacterium]MCB9219981.1 thioesterase family protein [Ignavibacteriales bacterium]
MSRIKLILPKHTNYSIQIDIRISDINYGGHLGNDSVLSLIHEARIRLLKDKGFSEIDIDGVGIIMVDSVIVYSSEGFYGDRVQIDVAVDDISSTGCDIFYRLVNLENDKEIAKAKTGIVFFDYKTKRISRTPEVFKNQFG